MKRSAILFILTHGYTLFLCVNLYFFSNTRTFQILSYSVPILFFAGIPFLWLKTSHIKLAKIDKVYIRYFIFNIIFLYCFYNICIFSSPKWIYDRNWQVALFLLATMIFYVICYWNVIINFVLNIINYHDRK